MSDLEPLSTAFRREDMAFFYRSLMASGYDSARREGWLEVYLRGMNMGGSGGDSEAHLLEARMSDYRVRWLARLWSLELRDRAAHDALIERVRDQIEQSVDSLEVPPRVK